MTTPPSRHRGIVLFGPGAGGDPGRYTTLTGALRDAGWDVLAPPAERFTPGTVTPGQLRTRVGLLHDALAAHPDRDTLPVVAVGHSIGGWAALCLAGARPCTRDGAELAVPAEPRVSRLVAIAPPVGWFAAPGALAAVTVPVAVHVGASDTVTPPSSTELLRAAPGPVTVTVHEGVGHFDVAMTELPPGERPAAGLHHRAFLDGLAAAVAGFLATP
ncbi:hypothetical protein ND486_26550 [Pseudonocardia sp. DR1-2]|uniref:alpha/beta hydrolase n=1 Tax=Pseudonocardia sp. DR1-2 TaxID=2951168 RepID=UPI0020437ABF|nr:hypothetical protein [Pseudonocardia sp. DR1-2]MCM3849757.1 hypothetical protein [Pseudonocardia sp. DR1-2]